LWADKLLSAIAELHYSNAWPGKIKEGFDSLFGSQGGRYPDSGRKQFTLRAPAAAGDQRGNRTVRGTYSSE
jgi:5-methylcytosine-specific restriction protein B